MRLQTNLMGASLSKLLAIPAAAKHRPMPDPCPTSPTGFKTADNVGAAFKLGRAIFPITTFYFYSFMNENPVGGVPGLIQYCVYLKAPASPRFISVRATGADGERWTFSVLSPTLLSFDRPDGDESNIPLNGTNTAMGSMF